LPGDAVSTDLAGADAMQDGARLIDGTAVARKVRDQVAVDVAALRARGIVPGLTVVLVGDDPASAVYVGGKEKASRDHREKELVRLALEKAEGNVTRAASYLGVSRPTLYQLLARYGLKKTSAEDHKEKA